MRPPISTPSVDWLAISPELALAAAGVVIVMLRALLRRRPLATPLCAVVAISGTVAAGAAEYRLWHVIRHHHAITTVAGMVRVDLFGVFLGVVVLAATILAILLSVAYLHREQLEAPAVQLRRTVGARAPHPGARGAAPARSGHLPRSRRPAASGRSGASRRRSIPDRHLRRGTPAGWSTAPRGHRPVPGRPPARVGRRW